MKENVPGVSILFPISNPWSFRSWYTLYFGNTCVTIVSSDISTASIFIPNIGHKTLFWRIKCHSILGSNHFVTLDSSLRYFVASYRQCVDSCYFNFASTLARLCYKIPRRLLTTYSSWHNWPLKSNLILTKVWDIHFKNLTKSIEVNGEDQKIDWAH